MNDNVKDALHLFLKTAEAKSKAQQRFFGLVRAVQKGEAKAPSKKVGEAAKGMSEKSVKDYAATKQKGLPEKKAEETSAKNTLGEKAFAGFQVPMGALVGYKAGKGLNEILNVSSTNDYSNFYPAVGAGLGIGGGLGLGYLYLRVLRNRRQKEMQKVYQR